MTAPLMVLEEARALEGGNELARGDRRKAGQGAARRRHREGRRGPGKGRHPGSFDRDG
jgi:hypothetical protein